LAEASSVVNEIGSSNGVATTTLDGQIDLLALHQHHPERYPHLLESVLHGTPQSRYDILFAFPCDSLTLTTDGALSGHTAAEGGDFLTQLDQWWRQQHDDSGHSTETVPFSGGWFLYLGYELAGEIEPSLKLPRPDSNFPTAIAVRHPAAIIYDHSSGQTQLIAEQGSEALLEMMLVDLSAIDSDTDAPESIDLTLNEEPTERYRESVEKILHYIREGDVFQVNLSRQWHATLNSPCSGAALYRQLRRCNPAPFAGLANFGDITVVSSSPERLVEVRGSRVQTRPIAGTRPRGESQSSDRALSDALLIHPKERAEHIMLIDLERNDLGRVAVPGSVEVDELMVLESYAHVHHIVSNVGAELRPGTTPGEVIRATFPGGTITGCPKVRCMEIIAELEGIGRGPYTGSMGYLNRNGDMDLNILIRTVLLEGNKISFRAGAGIVSDSDPEHELEETRAKARGMARVFQSDGARA